MGNVISNNCANCGQWAGRGHRCPTPSRTSPSLTVERFRPPSTPSATSGSVDERVARAAAFLASQTALTSPDPTGGQWITAADHQAAIAAADDRQTSPRFTPEPPIITTGQKYTGYRDATLVAKDVRADIKAAVKAGELPSDIKVSVRTSKASMVQSVDVRISGWPADQVFESFTDRDGFAGERLTPDARAVHAKVEAIRSAYDRSAMELHTDYQDVMYYGDTVWER